jgi:hypothetical protein
MMYQQMDQPYIGMAGGGLPALSYPMAPMAQQVQSQGRGEDTMLVHMTPGEINSLQGLAMAHGGSLTINPETGLPEAGFLGNILKKLAPTLIGAALAATGVGAPLAAGLVAAGSVAKTGSLKKGLMAGLSAYGGASLAGSVGLGGSVSKNAFGALGSKSGIFGANMGAGAAAASNLAPTVSTAAASPSGFASVEKLVQAPEMLAQSVAEKAGQAAAKKGLAGVAQRFGQTAAQGLPGGIIGKAAPMIAASGLMRGVTGAMTPSGGGVLGPEGQVDNSYQGPYYAQDRQRILDPEGANSSRQRRHFAVNMPEIYNTMGQVVQPGSQTVRGTQIMQPVLNPKAKKGQPMYNFVPVAYQGGVDPNQGMVDPNQGMFDPNQDNMYNYTGYAHGGEVQLSDGAFVLDARTVSEIGNGSSNAGMEALSRMGGRPVQGPGDGVSDSVPARIGRDQPARVARDEVIMPANVVRRIGKGDPQRGADKLYALMNKAHKARKKAGRGHDTKLARGLG